MPTQNILPKNAQEACESTLQHLRHSRTENAILPSEVTVIDRLLERGLELDEAYCELHSKLQKHPHALNVLFDRLLAIAAFWNPEANLEARKGRAQLIKVNEQIKEKATELANLLSERTTLKDHSGFSCDTHYHPVEVLHAAARDNHGYTYWVKEKLENVTAQFDLKYWPTLSECVQVIADDAARATPSANDAITGAGTEGPRAGLDGTFKAFFATIDEANARNHGFLPRDFQLTDRTVASLMSCALGLGADELVDAGYVKRIRQRQREKTRRA